MESTSTQGLSLSLQHQLLRDIEAHPKKTFKEIHELRRDQYGEPETTLYRAVKNRHYYLNKLKQSNPDRYWSLYATSNAHPVTDPEDYSSEEEEEEEEQEQLELEEELREEPPPANTQFAITPPSSAHATKKTMYRAPSPVQSSFPEKVHSSSSPFKKHVHALMNPAALQQNGGCLFSSVAEAKKFVYGEISS